MKGRTGCKPEERKAGGRVEHGSKHEARHEGGKSAHPKLKHGGEVKGERPRSRADRRARGGALSASSAKHPYSDGKSKAPADPTPFKRGGAVKDGDDDDGEGEGDDERASGGRLTAKERQGLPKGDFALPGKGEGPKGAGAGSYPIPDESHARNALARVSQHGSPAEKARVRAKVHAKYPDIK